MLSNETAYIKRILLLMGAAVLIFQGVVSAQDTPPPPPPGIRQTKQLGTTNERLAINYYLKKEYGKAALLYEELYNRNPKQFYYNYLFNCYMHLNRYKDAEKLIRKQKRAKPGNFRLDVDLAYVSGLMGNNKKERKIINDLVNNVPSDRNRVVQLAASLQAKGYFDDALKVYEKARKNRMNNYSFDIEMATAYQYTGDYDKMFDTYLNHLEVSPGDEQMIKNKFQVIINRDVDDNLSELLKKKLLEKTQQNPGNMTFASLMLWQAMQTKDFDMAYRQARAIDMRFRDQDELMMQVGGVAMSNKDYAVAEKSYGYVKEKKKDSPYYLEACSGYFKAIVTKAAEDPSSTPKDYKSIDKTGKKLLEELGLNSATAEIAGHLAHVEAFDMNLHDEAASLLNEAIGLNGISPGIRSWLKLELADIQLYLGQIWDASLLYSQVESDMKNEPIGHEAKYRNAKLFYYVGEYNWAKTKLDILKSATSKLIANDALELSLFIKKMLEEDTLGVTLNYFSMADLKAYQGYYDSAFMWLDSVRTSSAGGGSYEYMIFRKAGLKRSVKSYHEADSLYSLLVTSYPMSIKADNALYLRAEMNRLDMGDYQKSMELYLKLMKEYPESIFAGEARTQYRILRVRYGNDNPDLLNPDNSDKPEP